MRYFMKFQTISKFSTDGFYEPATDKPSRTDPFFTKTVECILSEYININGAYPVSPKDFGEYDDEDVEPEPNNKDLSYIDDNLDLINSLKTNADKVQTDQTVNNNKGAENEDNQDYGSHTDGSDSLHQETVTD